MNKIIRTLLGLFALGAVTTALQAQPAIKLVTVDVMSLFDKHYKTEEANAKFNDAAQKAQEQLDELNKKIQGVADEYKELMEQSKNAMLTPDAQKQKAEEAQKKIEEFQRMQAEAQNFRANTQRSLQQRVKTHRDLLLEEISKVVTDIAKRKGATLILDRSGPSLLGIPTVIYSDPAYDITEEVAKEINKDRPPAPPAAPAATPTPAPAATAPAPQFTVPNVSPKPADPKKP
ncbi:MAG: OmpH family outer membrane protein [Opitutae bacterium]|nr:OmpH family outer membrane protein [Opitutae bacterium]